MSLEQIDLDEFTAIIGPALIDRHWAELKVLIAELRASRRVIEAVRFELTQLNDGFIETCEALEEYDRTIKSRNEVGR